MARVLGGVTWKQFGRDLKQEISNDNVSNGAAALAYYLMLALFPAAIFLLSLLPYLPIPNLEQAIMDLVRQAAPGEAAGMFTGTVEQVMAQQRGGLLSVGLLGTLWAASNGIYAVMQQLNITYDVKEQRPFWKVRGLAVLLLMLFGVMIIGAFGLIVFGGVLQDLVAGVFGRSGVILFVFAALRWVIVATLLLLGFAVIYYFGPDVEQRFRFVSPGSVMGVVLLVIASLGFRLYVSNFADYNKTYGSLGAVIVLLLWLYITGFVILLGSEVNALIEHYRPEGKPKGRKREQPERGVPVADRARPPPPREAPPPERTVH